MNLYELKESVHDLVENLLKFRRSEGDDVDSLMNRYGDSLQSVLDWIDRSPIQFTVYRVPGDGSCFYHSMSRIFLESRGHPFISECGDVGVAECLRALAVQSLEDGDVDSHNAMSIVDNGVDGVGDLEELKKSVGENWANFVSIQALQRHYGWKLVIKVVEDDRLHPWGKDEEEAAEAFAFVRLQDKHYEPLSIGSKFLFEGDEGRDIISHINRLNDANARGAVIVRLHGTI